MNLRTTLMSSETLLQRLDRVRALARRLVRDGAEADDLVQEAVARALRRGSPVEGKPAEWFGATLRNLARDRARSQRRRSTREALYAPAEALADTTHAVELAELQRDVVAEVLALDEPERAVILLSFFEDLSLREVAARTGASLEAVKKRRQRGLERLRHRLAARHGDRATWAVALLPLTGRRVLATGLRMGALTTGVCALGALTVGLWLRHGEGASQATQAIAPRSAEHGSEAPYSATRVAAAPGPAPIGPASTEPAPMAAHDGAPAQDDRPSAPSETGADRPSAPHPLPELVRVPGGPTRIGSTKAEVERLLEQAPMFARVLDAQRPDHLVDVPTFWIGRYEVTNAEYLAFVRATERRPPVHWANEAAERAAAAAFAADEGRARAAAQARGAHYEPRKWVDGSAASPSAEWWRRSWAEVGYAVPEGLERHPVVHVDYADAEAFCAWHGMRLPTEYEYQRAARLDDARTYPWGDDWRDGEYANTAELRLGTPRAVGSFPGGASALGVLDLAGNVWEWTASPYVSYPGFAQGAYDVRVNGALERISAAPLWNPEQRVVVGGAFGVERVAARIATRRATDREQSTGALGFRVATSLP